MTLLKLYMYMCVHTDIFYGVFPFFHFLHLPLSSNPSPFSCVKTLLELLYSEGLSIF